MTLDTRFVFVDPVPARLVFDFCREMIGADARHTWKHDFSVPQHFSNPYYSNDPSQGLPAWLFVFYGADGPLVTDGDEDAPHEPVGCVKVSLDTAYSYRDDLGRNCGQLHATYVSVLGRWCERNGWRYHWQDESTGEWYDDWRIAADVLGQAGDAARDWFLETVLPAIENLDSGRGR